jgi:hypothetical protein
VILNSKSAANCRIFFPQGSGGVDKLKELMNSNTTRKLRGVLGIWNNRNYL